MATTTRSPSPVDPAAVDPTPVNRSTAAPKSAPKTSLTHRLWTGQVSYDFVGNRRTWYIFSAFLLVFCLVGIGVRGLQFSIEFSGGSKFQVDVAAVTSDTVGAFRSAAESAGVAGLDATVTTIGANRVSIETRSLEVPEQIAVRAAIAEQAQVAAEEVAYDQIGASWGAEVTRKAIIALVVFMGLVSLLIGLYFRYAKMAISALTTLLHDLIVTVGVYAWVGFSVTPATLTGVLTILGYSLYDTVVVFDKVRENWGNLEDSKLTYAEAANLADNQVVVRSLNTTIIGVLPVAALLFAGSIVLGSGPLEDIGLSLFVGMIAGAYSSIFLATPLLSQLKDLEPAVQEHDQRVLRRRAKAKRLPQGRSDRPDSEEPEDDSEPGSNLEDTVVSISVAAAADQDSPAATKKSTAERRQPQHRSRAQRKKQT